MKRALDETQSGFVAEVEALLADAQDELLVALADRGWTVPDWPRPWGGAALESSLVYLLDRCLVAADAPRPDALVVDLLGPLIMAMGTCEQGRRWLPGMARGQSAWVAHGSVFGGTPLAGRLDKGGRVAVDGALPVSHGRRADHLMAVVRIGSLPGSGPGELALAVAAFEPWRISAGLPMDPDILEVSGLSFELLGIPQPGPAFHQRLENVLSLSRSLPRCRSGTLARALSRLRQDAGAGNGTVRKKCRALEVAVRALTALEQRGCLSSGPDEDARALRTAAWIRAQELGAELAALSLEALGYHALPAPRSPFQHNELLGSGEDAMGELIRYVGNLAAFSPRDGIGALIDLAGVSPAKHQAQVRASGE